MLSKSVLIGNCLCQMLFNYMKLHTVSQYNYSHSHSYNGIKKCIAHHITIATPFSTRFNYKSFWNINALQAWLPRTISHPARFSSSFNSAEISLPSTKYSWVNNLTREYRKGKDSPAHQQLNGFKPQNSTSKTDQTDLTLQTHNRRGIQLQNF